MLTHLPHRMGTTPDCKKPPTESELADSDREDSDSADSEMEGEVRDYGDGDGFTSIQALASDSESGSEDKGHEAWHVAPKAEAEVWQKEPAMSCPRGWGKRKAETGIKCEQAVVAGRSSERPEESGGSALKSHS